MAKRFLSNINVNDQYTLPSADGTSGQIIQTDGSGNLSFVDFASDEARKIIFNVKNKDSISLSKGTVVHASPSANPPSGNIIEVIRADNNDSSKMPAIGVLNETLAADAEGECVMLGSVSGIATNSFNVGDELYVSDTPGEFINTKPTGTSNLIQKIAIVIKSHSTNGLIEVFGAGRSNDVPNQIDRNVNFTDNSKLTFGDSTTPDFQIYHDGNNSYINEDGTGVLAIQSNGTEVQINKGTSEYMARFITDGAVNLYYDNSKKFETTSTGVTVTGSGTFTGDVTLGDTSSDHRSLSIQTNSEKNSVINLKEGSNLYGFSLGYYGVANDFIIKRHDNSSSGTDVLTLNRDDNNATFAGSVGIGMTGTPPSPLTVVGTGVGASGTIGIQGANAHVGFKNSSGTFRSWVGHFNASAHGSDADLNLKTGYGTTGNIRFSADGDTTAAQMFLQGSTGNVGVGTDSPNAKLEVLSSQSNSSIRTGGLEMQSYAVNNSWYAENLYYDGAWKLRNNGHATQIYMEAGVISFKRVASGSAGASVSPLTTMVLASSGNVGIGVTSPAYKLQVSGAQNANDIVINNTTTGVNLRLQMIDANGAMFTTGTKDLTLGTNNTERMRIDSSGNILIGATGADIGGSNTGIRFNQAGSILASIDETGDSTFVEYLDRRGTNNEGSVIALAMQGFYKASIGVIGTSANVNDGGITFNTLATNGGFVKTERMRIDSSGLVRIQKNTASTTEPLLKLSNANGSTTDGVKMIFEVANTSGNGGEISVVRDGGSFNPYMTFNVSSGVASAPTERMRIDSSGRVGIGQSPTTAKLEVAGEARVYTGSNLGYWGVDAGNSYVYFGTNTSNYGLSFQTSGTERMRITSAGAIEIKGTSTTTNAQAFITNDNSVLTIGSSVSGSVVKDIQFNSPSAMMYIDGSSGNVGIGETTPLGKLHVKASDTTASANSAGNLLVLEDSENGMSILSSTSGAGYILFGDSGDNDIGGILYDHSANAMRFRTNGVWDRLRIDSSGNTTFAGDITVTGGDLTLGTDSIASNINAVGDVLAINVDSNTGGGAGANIQLKTAGTSQLTINSSSATFAGSVGIGTTSIPNPFSGAYSNILQVGTTGGNTRLAITAGSTSSSDLSFADSNDATNAGSYVGAISYKHNGDYMLFSTNGSEKMRISSDGILKFTNVAQTRKISLYEVANNNYQFYGLGIESNTLVYSVADLGDSHVFFAGSGTTTRNELMRIDGDGNVGIGVASPAAKLHVSGDTGGADSIARFQNTNSTAKSTRLQLLDSAGTVGDALIAYDHSNASSALHYLGMGVNNSTTLVINNNDKVGIGTASPSTKLHISGGDSAIRITPTGSNDPRIDFTDNGGTVRFYTGYDVSSGNFVITSDEGGFGSSNIMVMSDAGNVGIGTTSPAAPLDVQGTGALFITRTSGGLATYIENDGGYPFMAMYQIGGGAKVLINTNGSSYFNGGAVGIGTTAPFSDLSINVGANAPSSSGNMASEGLTVHNAAGGRAVQIGVNESGAYNYIQSSYVNNSNVAVNLAFFTGASEKMRITSAGNVGIGTTAPTYKLQVNGTAYINETLYVNGETTVDDNLKVAGTIQITGTGAVPQSGAGIYRPASDTLGFFTSGASMRLNSTGDILLGNITTVGNTHASFDSASNDRMVFNIGSSTTSSIDIVNFRNPNGIVGGINTDGFTTSFSSSSDYRLKENVVEMTDALDRVSNLKPSRFNFIGEEKTVDGFLAHEVSDIVPEAISGTKDAVDEKGNPIYQGIDQSKLVPLLVGAIQELKAEIENLKSQINN